MLFLSVLVSLMFVSTAASAKGLISIVYSYGATFETTNYLPDSVIINGRHVNFGVGYEQLAIFWIPMWNYGITEYVLVTDNGDEAYNLDEYELEYIRKTYGIDTTTLPSISFWNKIGGKVIWGIVIALIYLGYFAKQKNDDENAPIDA